MHGACKVLAFVLACAVVKFSKFSNIKVFSSKWVEHMPVGVSILTLISS